MQKSGTIDFARLLGFDTVAGDAGENLDLRNETISDRLGAKIGPIEPTIAVDFRDDTMAPNLVPKSALLKLPELNEATPNSLSADT